MPEEKSRSEQLGEIGARYRESLIKALVDVHGGRPSDAKPLSHEEELRRWDLPTSPAALEAFKRGATLEEAKDANRMWAEGMRAQAQRLREGGATDADIHQAGFSDEIIFKTTRSHAYERGKANGKNDPAIEVDYHLNMAKRAARQRTSQTMSYQTLEPEETPDAL